jgi:hypothetical protein
MIGMRCHDVWGRSTEIIWLKESYVGRSEIAATLVVIPASVYRVPRASTDGGGDRQEAA